MTKKVDFIRQTCRLLGGQRILKRRKPLENMGWMMGLEPTTTGITNSAYNLKEQRFARFMPNNGNLVKAFVFRRLGIPTRRILGAFFTDASGLNPMGAK